MIKAFEAPDFQAAYNSAIERKLEEPDFSAKVWAMAQREVNAEIGDTVEKTNSWLTEYIEKVLNPNLAVSREGIIYTKLIELDTEENVGRLGKVAKVLMVAVSLIAILCVIL